MTPTVKISDVMVKLQCGRCSSTLSDPRMLICKHQYCKRCLDDLLQFRPDGSALVKCPEGCTKMTRISNTGTTSDLDVDYRVKDIAEMVRKDNGVPARHINDSWLVCESCNKSPFTSPLTFCVICQKMKCEDCEDPHDNQHSACFTSHYSSPFLQIKFDARANRWSVLCSEHLTLVDSLCCGTVFVCLYCRHRKHQGHMDCEPFNDAERNLITLLQNKLKFAEEYDNARMVTNKKISSIRTTFEETLKVRKLKRLEEYLKNLNAEEEVLRKDFDQLVQEHGKYYVASDSKEYIRKCLQMNGLQLLFNKTDILMLAESQYRFVREMSVSLTDSHYRDDHPLGRLNMMEGDDIAIETSVDSFQGEFGENKSSGDYSQLIRSTFYASPNVRTYVQELGKSVRDSVSGRPSGMTLETMGGSEVESTAKSTGMTQSITTKVKKRVKWQTEEEVKISGKKPRR